MPLRKISMDTKTILNALQAERKSIDQAIAAIEGLNSNSRGTSTGGRPTNGLKVRRVRRMSAAGRKRLSELLKKRWASGKMGKRKKSKRRVIRDHRAGAGEAA
jgi:hypothetical protein